MRELKPTTSPYLTRDEAAAYLRVSRFTLSNWATRGIGPKFTHAGRRTLYSPADLQSWLESRQKVA